MKLTATAVPPPTWKRLRASATLAFGFSVIEYVTALLLTSLSAEADALHLFGDGGQSALAAIFAYIAHDRTERWATWSAYLQATCLAAAGALILWRVGGSDVHPREALAMIGLGAIATSVALWRLKTAHGKWDFRHLAVSIWAAIQHQAALDKFAVVEAIHVFLDVVTSAFVLLTGVLMLVGLENNADRYFAYATAVVAFASSIVVVILARMGHHDHNHCGHDHGLPKLPPRT